MKDLSQGLPVPDDPRIRMPIDATARIVTSSGEHFYFYNNSDEICSPVMPQLRDIPAVNQRELGPIAGRKFGRLTVIGLAHIANNGGYPGKDRMLPGKRTKSKSNYKGNNWNPLPSRKTGEARWVCRCDCGLYTLRSTAAIKKGAMASEWRTYEEACFQCRELDKMKKGVGKYAKERQA